MIMKNFSYGFTDPHALWIALLLLFFLLQVYISK